MATRRSHIVRVFDDSSGTVDKDTYIDVEVLDAISFKIGRGEEVILNFPAKKATPYIVDDTGHGLEKQPGASSATRRTHVEHIKGDNDTELLVEVLDHIAFKDKRGEEWILKMPSKKSAHFNVTKGTGGSQATMRTHNEKIGTDAKEKDPKDSYLTVERSDMIAFRSTRGREMILKMPSHDDGKDKGRADTHLWSPENYDPTDDEAEVPENKDPDFYVKFVKGKSPLTGDELIAQGPLWWIRKVSGGDWIVLAVRAVRANAFESYKIADWEAYEYITDDSTQTDSNGNTVNGDDGKPKHLKKFPFDKDKGPGFKSKDIDKNHKEWRGNSNDDSVDDFTALYFLDNTGKSTNEIALEFPGYGKLNPSTDIGYYVWLVSGGAATIYPPPDKDTALQPFPFGGFPGPYIMLYNNWDGDIGAWSGLLAQFAALGIPAPPHPDGDHFGWKTAADAQAFKEAINALNTITHDQAIADAEAHGQGISIPDAKIYETLTIDYGSGPPPKAPHADYTIKAYRITGRNNLIFDEENVLSFKLPDPGKAFVTRSFTQGSPSDKRKFKVKFDSKDGLSIVDA